jgi:hypothetical protein
MMEQLVEAVDGSDHALEACGNARIGGWRTVISDELMEAGRENARSIGCRAGGLYRTRFRIYRSDQEKSNEAESC